MVELMLSAPAIDLFDAVEAGVPTDVVDVFAGATGQAAASVVDSERPVLPPCSAGMGR